MNNKYPEVWVKSLVKPLWAQLNKDRYNTKDSVDRKFEEWWNEIAKTGRL